MLKLGESRFDTIVDPNRITILINLYKKDKSIKYIYLLNYVIMI